MTALAEALVLGASLGALYALMAMGVTVVYQAARVPNVAFVGIGTAAAVFHWDLVTSGGRLGGEMGWWAAFVPALALAAGLGVVTDLLCRGSRSSLFVLLGWTAVLLAGVNALWGSEPKFLPSPWPGPALVVGDFSVPRQEVAVLAIAAACAVAVAVLYRNSRFGLLLRASAAESEAAAIMGVDPALLRRGAWALGSVLAGVAVILLLHPVLSNTYETTVLLAFAFGGALFGGLRSLLLAGLGGLLLGIVPTLLEPNDAGIGGVPNLVAFALVAGLLLRRPNLLEGVAGNAGALPAPAVPVAAVGPGPVGLPHWAKRGAFLALLGVLAIGVPVLSSDAALEAWTRGVAVFLVCASIVVVAGWSGETPLGQTAFAGFGAFMAANLAIRLGLPHILAAPLAAASAVPFALLVGLPAVRARGRLPFAVLSIGLMVVASSLLWGPGSRWFTGDQAEIIRPDWMDAISGRPAASYYVLALGLATGVVWFAANLRRSRVGRAFAAVRDSEAGARSLGIDPARYRLVALAFSALVAGAGGVVLAYLSGPVEPARFAAFLSVQYLLYVVVGGAGSLAGTAVVVFAFEVAPALDGGGPASGPGAVLLLGALAVLAVRLAPGGLAGLVSAAGTVLLRRSGTGQVTHDGV